MKKQKALYEDVVTGETNSTRNEANKKKPSEHKSKSNDTKSSDDKKKASEQRADSDSEDKTKDDKEDQETSEDSGKKGKDDGKDESPHSPLEQRAEKLAEDPFMTPAQMKGMDGGTKEKEEEVDKEKGEKKDGESREKKKQEDIKKTEEDLNILSSRADKILFHAKAIFPIDFFPNSVTIDANKVNIIIRTFFWTETVTSVMLKEIMDVRVETTLFLGKLIIDYGPHPLKIWTVYVPSLWKKDALKAKEIIEGVLVLYRGENIDTTKLKPEQTLEEIKEVGKVEEERP